MDEDEPRELQLLLPPSPGEAPKPPSSAGDPPGHVSQLDLDLSISIGTAPRAVSFNDNSDRQEYSGGGYAKRLQELKQQTAEQIRAAAVENAYAERIRQLTRRELELAEKDFARARMVWERAREEVEKVERMKEIATRRISSSACFEITCRSCHQRFRP